jgi:hypothetical protein
VRLADFGSAVDEHAIASLYGPEGPSAAQQTREYAPPESFGAASVFDGRRRNGGAEADAPKREYYAAYDVFSVGVVALEVLCLGTPKVFASVDGRTRASVTRRLQGASEETKELALRVRALLELCVTPPLEIDGLLSWECTEDALAGEARVARPHGARGALEVGVASDQASPLVGSGTEAYGGAGSDARVLSRRRTRGGSVSVRAGREGTRFRVSKRLSRLLLVAAGRRCGVGDAIFVQGVVARWRRLRGVRVVVSS